MSDDNPVTIQSSTTGIVATVSVGSKTPKGEPTRYALALRRRAANRVRLRQGGGELPPIRPGNCVPCQGWGVVGGGQRCKACGGTGNP